MFERYTLHCSATKIVWYLGQVMQFFYFHFFKRAVKGKLLRSCSVDESCTWGLRGWSNVMILGIWKSTMHLATVLQWMEHMWCIKKKKARATAQQWEEMAGRGDIQNENTLAKILVLECTWREDMCVCVWMTHGTRKSSHTQQRTNILCVAALQAMLSFFMLWFSSEETLLQRQLLELLWLHE